MIPSRNGGFRPKNILIKEGEWGVVSGRSERTVVPLKTETAIESTSDDEDAYDLTSEKIIALLEKRDEWDDWCERYDSALTWS